MENTHVGPFLILERLGSSRRQRVFRARQTEQNREVALKFIKWPNSIPWEQALEHVQGEVTELRKLRFENLARTYGAGVHEEQIFFASQLIKGESLASILTRRGRLATDLVVEYGRQIAKILKYLHGEKIIHGRLTPDRLVITPDHQVKLFDLRICRAGRRRWDAPKRPQPDVAAYLAPEQFTQGPSPRADFYSLGVILYEMTAGELPLEPDTTGRMVRKKRDFIAPSASEKVLDCPVWLDEMITNLLQPSPQDRPYSANAIALAFDEIKKLDVSKKGAAAQLTGGFSPLNAGRDKSEAKKVLAKKSAQRVSQSEPFYQSIPFLGGALLLSAFAAIWFALPPSIADQVKHGQTLVQSNVPDHWEEAVNSMKPVMESDSALADQARAIHDQAKRKLLLDLARRGMVNRTFHSPVTAKFVDAYQFQQNQENNKAKALYFEIVQTTDPAGSKRHVLLEAKKRYQKLAEKITLPPDPRTLMALIQKTRNAKTVEEFNFAKRLLAVVYVEKSGEAQFEEVVATTQALLDWVNLNLSALENDEELLPPPDQ